MSDVVRDKICHYSCHDNAHRLSMHRVQTARHAIKLFTIW